ncbi:MAG: aminotransferase class V-fold PLP-dependent enzyme [Oscillospiraceae bacterium]|jgi:selenocysteine lyase/cysteine desulfurase|nr:aminotransferase class V-fold PLP-dependent enzyme [Oscillospiraceae bacterium]
MIYFDNAATTLRKPKAVEDAAARAVGTLASPGRGAYSAAADAAETAYKCRALAANYFNVSSPESVVFTFNATHGLNIAVNALSKRGERMVISGYEHNAVLRPAAALGAALAAAQGGLFSHREAIQAFDRALTNTTRVCVVNHISNVFGFIQPIEKIAEMCRDRNIPLILDASQSAGAAEIDFDALGAEFIAMPGHKGLYGPQGSGLLLCRDAERAIPLLYGGSGSGSKLVDMPMDLPDRLEAGTLNMPGIAGLYEGLKFVASEPRILRHESNVLNYAADGLALNPRIKLFRNSAPGLQSGVLSFIIHGIDCEAAAERLSERGIAVRAGQHCAPQAHLTAGTANTGTIRASFSAFNTLAEADVFVNAVSEISRE